MILLVTSAASRLEPAPPARVIRPKEHRFAHAHSGNYRLQALCQCVPGPVTPLNETDTAERGDDRKNQGYENEDRPQAGNVQSE